MILILPILALIAAPLFHGKLRLIASVRLRALWLLVAAFGLQGAAGLLTPGPRTGWRVAAYLGSYPLAGAFLFVNRRTPGFAVVAIGGSLNLLAILANGGVMPGSAHALAAAGITPTAGVYANSAVVIGARLPFLGDILAVPASWPMSNAYSVGDLMISVGVAITILRVTGARLRRPQRRGRPGESREVSPGSPTTRAQRSGTPSP